MNRHRTGLRHVDRLVHFSVVASEKQWMSGTTRLAAPEAQRGHIVADAPSRLRHCASRSDAAASAGAR